MSKSDLKTMSNQELTAYIMEHRNNDEIVRAAIAESSSRTGWTQVPAATTSEETDQIIQKLLSQSPDKKKI